jgi:hypothetical protein
MYRILWGFDPTPGDLRCASGAVTRKHGGVISKTVDFTRKNVVISPLRMVI